MTDTYKWGIVTVLPDGHRMFPEHNSQRIAIADNSGREPQDTDDGILWMDFTDDLTIAWNDGVAREAFTIPLLDNDGVETKTISDASTLLFLSSTLEWPIRDQRVRQTYSVQKEGE
jgi:hypothetical protein